MSGSVPSRRIIALVAAYVVALQALLLPLSVAAGAAIPSSLCAASAAHTQSPADTACPCAAGCGMRCCAQALTGPPQQLVAWIAPPADALTQVPVLEPSLGPAEIGPQAPRAPPAA